MDPVTISNKMTKRLIDRSTMESSHIEKLQLSGLSKQGRQIHIFKKMETAPLISLGFYVMMGETSHYTNEICQYRIMEKNN